MAMNGETTLSTIPRVKKPSQSERKAGSSQVDWEEIRRKVLEGSAALAWSDDVRQEVLEQTWARRAAKLAQLIEEEETEERVEIVLVRLGREVYGLETDYVFNIRPLENITRVPRVPRWVAGVVNLRGRAISALDLANFLGVAPMDGESAADTRYVILVETPDMEIALIVDEVLTIETLPLSQIQETNSAVRGINTEYMRGIVVRTEADHSQEKSDGNVERGSEASHNGHSLAKSPGIADPALLVVLDLPVLLADKRLIVHEDVL